MPLSSSSPRSFSTYVEQKLGKFPHFLIYVILEWVMIILLFIDGFLAFISNEFARFFELDTPCLHCTRIDHVFVHRDSTFYYNESICEEHKQHISSLAYCHVHKKLSDLRNMCEGCLLSFAMEKDSALDRQRSLAGIFQKDLDKFVGEKQKTYLKKGLKEDEHEIDDNSWCSCCGDPFGAKKPSKFNRSYSMNSNIAPTPSPRAPLVTWRSEEARNIEMPHIHYTELKFNFSDTESELPDEEDASNADIRRREDLKAVSKPLLLDAEEIGEDGIKTPLFAKGNRFFRVPLPDSAQASPRYKVARKMPLDLMSEPIDMNAISEGGDNESILNRLKTQVRIDRKSLIALYMELDEERSASTVAANNAMAMITRLQAEKAAVQMETLQYQRMMDEQAEYDQEAIQELKDFAIKREADIKALESELEVYRERYGHVTKIASDICEVDADDDYQELKSQFSSFDDKSDCSSPRESDNRGIKDRGSERSSGENRLQNHESYFDFERERSYLLGFLTDLERQLNVPSEECEIDNEKRSIISKEVQLISERLRDVEADIDFLKHAATNLQKGGEGTKLLMEMAQHLRNLRRSVKKIPETTDALTSTS